MHIIDVHTLYQTAEFITSKSATELWYTFLRCWATIFVGYARKIRVDHETAFDSDEFRKTAMKAGFILQFSGIESHNSLAVGKKYHGPLRRVYNKLKDDYPNIDNETRISHKRLE